MTLISLCFPECYNLFAMLWFLSSRVALVQGKFPQFLIEAWDDYDFRKDSDNDRPGVCVCVCCMGQSTECMTDYVRYLSHNVCLMFCCC